MDGGLIVETDEGLQFFKTSDALESYAEAIDVEDGEYGRCWDPEGNLYQLRTGESPVVGLFIAGGGSVTVQPIRPPTNAVGELRNALVAFLVRLGEAPEQVTPLSTRELLVLGLSRAGWME